MTVKLNEVDKIEILTLQDNYIDVAAFDSTEVVQRGMPRRESRVFSEHTVSGCRIKPVLNLIGDPA